MTRVALAAFVVGVFLHVCIVYAVLDDGGGGTAAESGGGDPQQPAAGATPRITPTPIRLADRTNCAEIRNTDYRSEVERQWFLANCRTP